MADSIRFNLGRKSKRCSAVCLRCRIKHKALCQQQILLCLAPFCAIEAEFCMRQLFLPALLLVTLAGCASAPNSIVLGPQVRPGECCVNQNVDLQVIDKRVGAHLATLIEDGKRTQVPAHNDVEDSIRGVITAGLQQRGIQTGGGSRLRVEIQQLGATVSSGLLKHDTLVAAQLLFVLQTSNGEVTRAFNGQRSDTKPTRPDVAYIEKELNTLLGRVLTEALNDPQLLQAIRDDASVGGGNVIMEDLAPINSGGGNADPLALPEIRSAGDAL